MWVHLLPFDGDQTGRRGEVAVDRRAPPRYAGSLTGLTRPPHETHASTRRFVPVSRFLLHGMSPKSPVLRGRA
jgi:hypothetical protein